MPNCSPPPYSYRPTFVESSVSCVMDKHQELRGRSPVGLGGTFFRTKDSGSGANDISIEMTLLSGTYTLTVRDLGATVETFTQSGQGTPVEGVCSPNLISVFRTDVNTNSTYIEMPTIDYGGEPASSSPLPIFDADDGLIIPGDAGCLSAFGEVNFADGSGGPKTGPIISGVPPETQPRTGPERTMYVILLTEIVTNTASDDGQSYEPLVTEKIKQWDGTDWISYQPNVC